MLYFLKNHCYTPTGIIRLHPVSAVSYFSIKLLEKIERTTAASFISTGVVSFFVVVCHA